MNTMVQLSTPYLTIATMHSVTDRQTDIIINDYDDDDDMMMMMMTIGAIG